ncbi:MAG: sugar nucleotide-binding protein [Planctomycetota bacterium]
MTARGTTMILGAGGFLGPHLVRAALAAGAPRVVAVRRGLDPPPGVPPHPALAARAVDARFPRAAERLLDEEQPAAIVLSAALASVAACRVDPEAARRLHVELPAAVASWSARHGTRLVLVSTDLVFGGAPPRGERYAEEDPPSPVHAYGRSKAAGEEAVRRLAPGALVVRLPLLYGDSAGRGLGASDSLLAAVARGERPRLFRDEWRTPLEVAAAAAAVLEALATDAAGLLHVAGPRRLSRLELGLAILRAHGAAAAGPLVEESTRAAAGMESERPADVSLDLARARGLLRTPLRAPEEVLRGAPS